MQGQAIVNRILLDAQEKAKEIIETAELKASEILADAKEFEQTKQTKAEEKSQEKASEIAERNNTLAKIEGRKIILNKKQNILKDLKQQALDVLLQLEKPKMLELVEKLLKKNAEKNETLFVNIKGLTNKDIEGLEIVKKLSLNVSKAEFDSVGLVLSNDSCDKNLLFEDLISASFSEVEDEVNAILF